MQELADLIKIAVKETFNADIEPELTRPEEQFGDFSTNVALQLAAEQDKKPRDIAQQLVSQLKSPMLAKIEVAGPGFINFWLSDEALAKLLAAEPTKSLKGQEVVVEYSDPNPFKVLHVGHLYTSVVGDAIAKVLESAGAKVHRVNFGGDVGLHVAKTMWAILSSLGGELPEKLAQVEKGQRAQWLAERYVQGNNAYEKTKATKTEIEQLNVRLYQIHEQGDKASPLAQIYWTTRSWSYEYFDEFYGRIGSHFEKYYPESETAGPGLKAVKANIGKVFEESDGAIVFKGEVHNMHTRVFINSQGLPTYETKDVGLILKKWEDYHFDKSIVITGNEIYEYMQVVLKAVEQFAPELVQKTTHITHGLVKLAGGMKMSSRLGNIIKAEDVLDAAMAANKEINQQENADIALGAVKYAFLKSRIGADIIFDPAESVSLQGNSGPYLQYAYVRARSILQKAEVQDMKIDKFEEGERSLARKISEYPEVIEKAVSELMPHHIATYLYELAQTFNRFYENNRVVGNSREALRLKLVESYANTLKNGLKLLNIPVLERM
ncbi:MAG TPA: arginine--tRNA ligase [Candidatus Saccharimonadales bacterium]|nr:arginine--tRNA ligase [Candidatus Saccharimonadales bacterium]